jgi:hypothetical protein
MGLDVAERERSWRPGIPRLGWWAVLAIFLVGGIGVYIDLARFCNPVGEKVIPVFPPGQADFAYVYVGARALVDGVNPYRNNRREYSDPLSRGVEIVDGVQFKQLYPPAHILLYAPLAWWKGADWQAAGRVWFHVTLVGLVGLAALVWSIARRVTEAPLTPLWILVFLATLTLSIAVELGLERGQSDIFSALVCWTAVICFLRTQYGLAVFLAICGAALKGYPVPFAAGLGLLALRRRSWKQALVGAMAGLAVTVLPVAHYYADGMRGVLHRSNMFWGNLHNQGFRNAVYQLAPAWADDGRLALSAFALVVTVMAWVQARRTWPRGSPAARALWLSVFTTAALTLMIGYSSLSVSYNLILVMPGVLILVVCQQALAARVALPRWAGHVVGMALLAIAVLIFLVHSGVQVTSLALSVYGLVGLLLLLGAVLARALHRPVAA